MIASASDVAAPPRLPAPPGACDCHMHVYGPPERYRIAPGAKPPPAGADLARYCDAVMRRLGLSRVVVVQPSAYGMDNACTLDAVAALGAEVARAVVAVTPETPEAELARLHALGARGARFVLVPEASHLTLILHPQAMSMVGAWFAEALQGAGGGE